MKVLGFCSSLILSFIFLSQGSPAFSPFPVFRHLNQNPERDGKLCKTNETMFSHTVDTKVRCAALCVSKSSCKGAFYQQDTGLCFGCSTDDVKESLHEASGTVYLDACKDVEERPIQATGSSYIFGSSKVAFWNARKICQSHCAEVLQTETEDENSFIKRMLSDEKIRATYIGLVKDEADGQWKWLANGNETTFSDWATDQSEVSGMEICIAMEAKYGYKWTRVPCTADIFYICEKKLI